MNHLLLNKELDIKALSDAGNYEDKFHLKLTSKHALAVGVWSYKGMKGVDLRRFSYDETRLLSSGLTLTQAAWEKLFLVIVQLQEKKYFTEYGDVGLDSYKKIITADNTHHIVTSVFDAEKKLYLCASLCDINNKQIWKGYKTPAGILILFTTIPELISKCLDEGLIEKELLPAVVPKAKTDRKTGRTIH